VHDAFVTVYFLPAYGFLFLARETISCRLSVTRHGSVENVWSSHIRLSLHARTAVARLPLRQL